MAMKKAELESHRDSYYATLSKAKNAHKVGDYHAAIRHAQSAWAFIDPMMQFERRFNDTEFVSVDAVDLVLEYAPLLFEGDSLLDLEALLKKSRRIDKNTEVSLKSRLSDAQMLMWEAYHLWESLEHGCDSKAGTWARSEGASLHWEAVATEWERMGVVSNESGTLKLATRMNEKVLAKCTKCGVVARAAKAKFLREQSCPRCKVTNNFVILRAQPDSIRPKG